MWGRGVIRRPAPAGNDDDGRTPRPQPVTTARESARPQRKRDALMHDPMIVLFTVRSPIPRLSKGLGVTRWKDGVIGGEVEHRRWACQRHRFTNPEPEYFNKPIYRWWRPKGYDVAIFGRRVTLRYLCTIWHVEPNGRDSGEVCKGPRGQGTARVLWMLRHWRHLHLQVHAVQAVRAWFQRCEGCKQRMHRNVRIGTSWDGPGVMHNWCSSLRHVRGQLADCHAYIDGRADQTQKWRVEYEREGRIVRAAEGVLKAAEADG